MPAIARLHRLGKLAGSQGKGCFLKGPNHLATTKKTEVSTSGGGPLIVGDHPSQLGEILTGLDLLAQAADLLFDLQRILCAGHLGEVHVFQLYLIGMLVVGHILLVVGGQIFVGDLNLVIRSVAGGKSVFDADLFVGLGKVLARLVGTHLRGAPQQPL